jgi:hypothetical protein
MGLEQESPAANRKILEKSQGCGKPQATAINSAKQQLPAGESSGFSDFKEAA